MSIAIARLIRHSTSIEELELKEMRCHQDYYEDDDHDVVYVNCGIVLATLFQALGENTTLKRLSVGKIHRSFEYRDNNWTSNEIAAFRAFGKTLRTNYTLCHCTLVEGSDEFREEAQFYLKLNRIGRGRLIMMEEGGRGGAASPPTEEWINTILTNKDDVSIVFYLLQQNPQLLAY